MRGVHLVRAGLITLVLLTPAAALAQQPPHPQVGANVYVLFDQESLAATQSFTAVLGTSRVPLAGAGIDIVRLWKGLFVRVAIEKGSKTGSRVFVDSSQQVFPLNVPLTVTMTPVEAGAGWRLPAFDRKGHVVPYLGAAALWLRYEESSSFADTGENTDATYQGAAIFAGVEGNVSHLNLGVEGVYRRVPNAVGAAGVSSTFKENDLGGAAVRVRIGVGF